MEDRQTRKGQSHERADNPGDRRCAGHRSRPCRGLPRQGLDHGGRLLRIEGPNHDEARVRDAVTKTIETFGGLSELVNNAGFSRNMPLEQLSLDDLSAMIVTNLTGSFLCAKHTAPHLCRAKGATVNLLALTRAFMSEPDT